MGSDRLFSQLPLALGFQPVTMVVSPIRIPEYWPEGTPLGMGALVAIVPPASTWDSKMSSGLAFVF